MSDTPKPVPADESAQADLAESEAPAPASGFAKRLESFFEVIPFLGGVFIVVLSVEPLRNFIWDSRQVIIPIVVFAAVVIPTILLMPIGQRWLRESKASTRAGLFIFFMLVLVSIVAIVSSLGKN